MAGLRSPRQFVGLPHGRPCRGQPAGRGVHEGAAEGEAAGESGQHAAVAGTVDTADLELLRRHVVEQIGCGEAASSSRGKRGRVPVRREECPTARRNWEPRRVPARYRSGVALEQEIGGGV